MSKRTVLTILTILVAVVLVGCSKEEAPAPAPSQPAATTTAPPVDTANAATITGKVNYKDGKPRRVPSAWTRRRLQGHAQERSFPKTRCSMTTARALGHRLREGWFGGRTFPLPRPGGRARPGRLRLLPARGGRDDQPEHQHRQQRPDHAQHSPRPKVNREWNESQPPGAGNLTKAFAREEMAIREVQHSSLMQYIHVFSHPYFSVTKEDGTFELKGLPPGEYTIAVWSEALGTQEQKVTVAAKEAKTVDFTLTGK
jgi:hypothetical protein